MMGSGLQNRAQASSPQRGRTGFDTCISHCVIGRNIHKEMRAAGLRVWGSGRQSFSILSGNVHSGKRMRAVHYCFQPAVALYTASAVLHHQYRLTRHCGLSLNVVACRHEGTQCQTCCKVEYTQAQGSIALSVTVIFPSLNTP